MPTLCRDCLAETSQTARCESCGGRRLLSHPELFDLSIAHMDCDAFFASVEKRDNPELRDKPVIVGGGRRGVVSTACYLARIKGVRSAMPMFKALELCPDAVVVRGRMDAYAAVSRDIRAMMQELTPAVEPLSLDEAFLDLTGTRRLHAAPPAVMLARLVKRMEDELGLTGSVGLSHNKFLAKVASDLDKPRGFAVIGAAETANFLRDQPVNLIWGVGAATQDALGNAGIRTFEDLLRWDSDELTARFGAVGHRLWHLARGQDARAVSNRAPVKSISHETTFSQDKDSLSDLEGHLWRLCEKVSDRAKDCNTSGQVVILKLKRADHGILTRRQTLDDPTQLADRIYRSGVAMLRAGMAHAPFRLIGIGLSDLQPNPGTDHSQDLFDPGAGRRAQAERASDSIRAKFGDGAILKGRALR